MWNLKNQKQERIKASKWAGQYIHCMLWEADDEWTWEHDS